MNNFNNKNSLNRVKACLCHSLLLLFISVLWSSQTYANIEISEFMASNDKTLLDEDGDDEDWIELHNFSNGPIDLTGWYLTDDDGDLTQWRFPNVVLQADEYLIVFASKKDRAVQGSELHTNFSLKSGGEYLGLIDPQGNIVSEYADSYPPQLEDVSYGGTRYFTSPTPGSENTQGVAGILEPVEFSLEHGVYETPQTLSLNTSSANAEIRYTLDGSEPSVLLGCTPPSDGRGWSYEYFEGSWSQIPNFDNETPLKSGTADVVSIDPRERDTNYGLRFKGCINALVDGYYIFEASSDDGTIVSVDGTEVINNDGLHGTKSVSNGVYLTQGLHSVSVDYFQAGGAQSLSTTWAAPLRGKSYLTVLDKNAFYVADPTSDNFIEFEFNLPTDGTFKFLTNTRGIHGGSNSFWVQLNDRDLWLFHTGVTSSFEDSYLTNNGSEVIVDLPAGEHKLTFFVREDGTEIDYIKVIGSDCDGPCEIQTLEAERAKYNGEFIAGGVDFEPLHVEKWLTYNSPIAINKTSTVRAVAAQADYLANKPVTQTYLFMQDVIRQSDTQAPMGWPTANINNQILNYGMDPEIVNQDPAAVEQSLLSLPSISIVTDIDNLMHPDFGIYVNAVQKGRHWERPASIELIDPSGNQPGFTIDAGIRIRGGFSRTSRNPKHPFRVYFRGSYGGDLKYSLFGNEGVDSYEKIDLRSPNNYNWAFGGDNRNTFLREIWSRDTQAAMGNPYTRSRYYHLYVNGHYWGVNMTQERISKEYAESYFGGDEDDYDVVKHNRQDGFRYEASEGFNASWNKIWEVVSDEQVTDQEYSFINGAVNLDNLADYVITNAYEGDMDGSASWFLSRWKRGNNWYAVHDRKNGLTKWSFFQHDGEHTLGARRDPLAEENVLGAFAPFNGEANEFFSKEYMHPYWLHAALLTNSKYVQKFKNRAATHFGDGGALTKENALKRWNTRKEQVQGAVLAHSARWGDAISTTPLTKDDWLTEVDFVENIFFSDRSEVVYQQLLDQGLATELPSFLNDVAIGKSVRQSSTAYDGVAERAIDGNIDGFYNNASTTHTNNEFSPWWEIDLGEIYNLETITLWNRTDCCSERLTDFDVLVSDVPFTSNDLNVIRTQAGVMSIHHSGPVSARTTNININRSGRYVRIQLAGQGVLSLAEVKMTGGVLGGGANLCSEPNFDKATEQAVFLWKDCPTGQWNVRLTGGGDSDVVMASGNISSTAGFDDLAEVSIEGSDTLGYNSSAQQIIYQLRVRYDGMDGFSFIPRNADACFVLEGDLPLYLGENKVPVTAPLNLDTLGSCTAPAEPQECNQPNYDKTTERAVFLWKDCPTNQWHMRLSGGGDTNGVVALGSVLSTTGFDDINGFSIEGNDTFDANTNPNKIIYDLRVWNAAQDGFDFMPSGSDACFVLNSDAPLYLGENKVPITGPLNLDTLASCSVPIEPAECGEPNYDRTSEPGVFLWKDCNTNSNDSLWQLRVAGGGLAWSPYIGSIVSSNLVTATGEQLEPNDIVDGNLGDNGLNFTLSVANSALDGINFTIPANSQTCFDISQAPATSQVYVGRNRLLLTNTAFNLENLSVCQ